MIAWGAVECLLKWASLSHWESRSLLVMIRVIVVAPVTKELSQPQRCPDSGLHFCGPGHRTQQSLTVFMAVISGPGRRYERRGNAEPCVDGLEKSSGLRWWSVACY